MGNELSEGEGEGEEKARFGVEGERSGVGPASRGVQVMILTKGGNVRRETEGKMESGVS